MSALARIMRDIANLLAARDAEIERLYVREDCTLSEIAAESGMHQSSISRILHKREVAMYGPGRPGVD